MKPDDGSPEVFFHVTRFADEDGDEPIAGDVLEYELGMDRSGRLEAVDTAIVKRADGPHEAKDRNPAKGPEPIAEQQDATGATYVIERRRCG